MGCLQSYFRKGSYDVYEAHSTGLSPSPSSAAAAAVTSAKPSTPPGSNGHAPEGVEEDSPPPRPPPKKSHEAKAQAAAAAAATVVTSEDVDPSQPPALPPKRHSKASSGSQSVKVEPQPEPAAKSDASSSKEGTPAPAKIDSQESAATPQPASKEASSPSEAVTPTPPPNETLVSEATETPAGTNSSDAASPLKKDEVTTSPITAEGSKDEGTKSPGTGDAQDGSQMSTPVPMETMTPTSVVISPPNDEGGSLGEKISPLEDAPVTPSTEVQEEVSRDTPTSRPQSIANPPEVAITPPDDKPFEVQTKDDVPRPSSGTSKEMESTSGVSSGIVTDSAAVEEKESPTEAAVIRRSVVGQEEEGQEGGKETPKGRDSGLSSDEGSTPIAVGHANDSGQGPAAETCEATEVRTGEPTAPTKVPEEVNKTEIAHQKGDSRPASAVVETTQSIIAASVDECKDNAVPMDSKQQEEKVAEEEVSPPAGVSEDVDGEKVGKEKSFGFGDSASQDTVVHVKTEGSTEIPNSSSQEKEVSPKEEPETNQKTVEDVHVTEESTKQEVEAVQQTPPAEVKKMTEEASPEVPSPPAEPEPAPQSPAKETEVSSPMAPEVSPPAFQDEQPPLSPVNDEPSPPVVDTSDSIAKEEKAASSPQKEPETAAPAVTVVTLVSKEEPTQASPTKEEPVLPPVEEAANAPVKDVEPTPPSTIKEAEPSPAPITEEIAPVQKEEEIPSSPSKEEKEEIVSPVQKEPAVDMKAEVKEEAVPESPKDKSEASSEEFPPPPPPEAEKETEQQVSEAMPPPPPPEDMVAVTTEVPEPEVPKSQERPLSATEEEVASILLGQTQATESALKKEEQEKQEEDQKDLPPPPPAAQEGNAEEDFPPPPPDMTEDVEVQSPVEADGRTRSASFELVEVLNLGGSLEEGEEGAGDDKMLREGRGLVKRVPTPVNADWPPNQEEEDEEEEERASISPEATATPSVTPESKPSEDEGAGPKLAKDAGSGSLEGISEVASPRGELKEVKSPKETATQVQVEEEPKEIVAKAEKEASSEEGKESPLAAVETIEQPAPSAPDEEVIVAEGGERIPGDIEVPECTVTNLGPPPEVLATLEAKMNAAIQQEEDEEEERAKSSEEVRKEVEEVSRVEVDEVIKKAVVEAERRDRESRMSGELVDEDTVVVEAATNGHNHEEEKEEKNSSSPEVVATSQGSVENNSLPHQEAVKPENHNDAHEVSSDEAKAVDGNPPKVESPIADKKEEKAGKDSLEVKNEIIANDSQEKTNGVNGSHETAEDPSAVTKVKTPVKSKVEGEVNGDAEKEGEEEEGRRSAPQSGSLAAEEVEATIEGGRAEEEEAAAIKIQSTFRGYAVRRDTGRAGKGVGEAKEEIEALSGGGKSVEEAGGGGVVEQPPAATVERSTAAQTDAQRIEEADDTAQAEEGPEGEKEEDRRVWERLEEERRDLAASCIQRGFREFKETGKRLRREDALQERTNSSSCEVSGSSTSFQRASEEFQDQVVPQATASEGNVSDGETGGMRQGCGVPADGSESPQGDVGARGLMDSAAARIQAGYRGYRVRKRLREVQNNGTNNHSASPNSQSEMSNGKEGEAATKIQAGVRGFLTRRRLKRRREDDCENQERGPGGGEGPHVGPDEAEKAAVKIQAGFRGYKGRQKAKARRQQDGKKEVK